MKAKSTAVNSTQKNVKCVREITIRWRKGVVDIIALTGETETFSLVHEDKMK